MRRFIIDGIRAVGCASWLLASAGVACCVAGEMLVRTPTGEVPAGSLVVGDVVISVDPVTRAAVRGRVVKIRRAQRECVALRWDGGELICTPEHPLLSPETGTYRPAADWVTGAARTLLAWTPEGSREVAVRATSTFAGIHEVVDLSVDAEPHNFVAGGIVVHNKHPAGEPLHTATAEGPSFTLYAEDLLQRFYVKICDGGEDIDDPQFFVGIDYDARVGPADPLDEQSLELYAFGEFGSHLFESTVAAPDSGTIAPKVVPSSCDEGVLVVFRREAEPAQGTIAVSWTARASVPEVTLADLDDLVVTIEPVSEDDDS